MGSTSCPARTSPEPPTETRSSAAELLLNRTSSGRCPSVSRENPPNRKNRDRPEVGDRDRPGAASFGTAWGKPSRAQNRPRGGRSGELRMGVGWGRGTKSVGLRLRDGSSVASGEWSVFFRILNIGSAVKKMKSTVGSDGSDPMSQSD